MAIIHLHVPRVAQLGLFARAFARQPRLGIGGRLMSVVGTPLAMKVHARIAGIIRRSLALVAFALEAFVPGPRLDQRTVNRKMLVREQAAGTRLLDHRAEKALRHLALKQPLAVLGEHRHVPHRIVDAQAHEPAEQEIVIELLHQHPLTAHRIQHLHQQRAQQLLRRDRGPSSASAASAITRIARSGWSLGTRCSADM
jgi:hypothetical protein